MTPNKHFIALVLLIVTILLIHKIQEDFTNLKSHSDKSGKSELEENITVINSTSLPATYDPEYEEYQSNRTFPSQKWVNNQVMKSLKLRKVKFRAISGNIYQNCSRVTLHKSYFFPKSNLIFTGVAKSGCTNMLQALLIEEDLLKGPVWKYEHYKLHLRITEKYRMTHFKDAYKDLARTRSFTVVRNPWVRMVSGYVDKLSGNMKRKSKKFKMIGYRIVARQRQTTLPRSIASNLHPTFDEYIQFLLEEIRPYQPGDYILSKYVVHDNENPHFSPQYKTLDLQNIKYTYIAALELLPHQLSELKRMLELDSRFEIPGPYDDVTDETKQTSVVRAREWLSEVDGDVIERLYKKFEPDFVIYNYSNFSDSNFPFPNYK